MQTSRRLIPGARPAWLRWRWRPAVLGWALWALAMLGLAVIAWLDHLLRQAGRPDLALFATGFAGPECWRRSARPRSGRCWPAAGPAIRWGGCCWPWGCQ